MHTDLVLAFDISHRGVSKFSQISFADVCIASMDAVESRYDAPVVPSWVYMQGTHAPSCTLDAGVHEVVYIAESIALAAVAMPIYMVRGAAMTAVLIALLASDGLT